MAARSLIGGIAEQAAAPIGQIGSQLIVKATFVVLSLAGLAVGAVFLTSALYAAIEQWLGSFEAMLVVGGLYVALAVVFAIAAFVHGHGRSAAGGPEQAVSGSEDDAESAPLVESGRTTEALGIGAIPGSRELGTGHALDRIAVPMLDLLREQGMERERLALAAGVMAAKELRPWMLVGLMVVMGVVLGQLAQRRLKTPSPVSPKVD